MSRQFNRTQTYNDVSELLPEAAKAFSSVKGIPDFAGGVPHSSRGEILDDICVARQAHEDQTAEVVIVCEPEGTSLMMGGLHPRASLFEKPVNLDAAKEVRRRCWVSENVVVGTWGHTRRKSQPPAITWCRFTTTWCLLTDAA